MSFRVILSLPTLVIVAVVILSSQVGIGRADLSQDCLDNASWLSAQCTESGERGSMELLASECRAEARLKLTQCLRKLPAESLLSTNSR